MKVSIIFIPGTRRVKGYTRFVGKYVTVIGKRFRAHKVNTAVIMKIVLNLSSPH